MSLSSLIVQREIATIREVEEALARQVLYGGDLVTNLFEVTRLQEARISPILAESYGMSAAPVGELPPPEGDTKSLVPQELATLRTMIPLGRQGSKLLLAVAEPLSADVENELVFALGMPIEQRIAPSFRVRQAIAREYGVPLERRVQRLLSRISGQEAKMTGSLPPLLREHTSWSMPPKVRGGESQEAPRHHNTFTGLQGEHPTGDIAVPPPPRVAAVPAPPEERPEEPPRAAEPPRLEVPNEGPPAAATTTDRTPPLEIPEAHAEAAPAPAPPPAPEPAPAPPPPAAAPPVAAAAPALTRDAAPAPAPALAAIRSGARAKRRRGPLTPDAAREELDEAADRDTILNLFFDFSRQYFDYTALFIVQSDIAEGRDAFGDGASRARVVAIGVPLDLPSVFAHARASGMPLVETPARDGLDAVLLADLQRPQGAPVLVVPVVVRSRAVALLYGDSGPAGIDEVGKGEVAAFALEVGQAFERLIVRKKLVGGKKKPSNAPQGKAPSVAPPPAAVPAPSAKASSVAPPVPPPVAAPEAEKKSEQAPPAKPPAAEKPAVSEKSASVAPPANDAISPRAQSMPAPPPPAPPPQLHEAGLLRAAEALAESPSLPAHLLPVRRPSGKPIPREEPEREAPASEPPPTEVTPSFGGGEAPNADAAKGVLPHADIAKAAEESKKVSSRPPLDPSDEELEALLAAGAYPEPTEGETIVLEVEGRPPPSPPVSSPPSSSAISVPARRPPSSHSRVAVEELPSVIVDVQVELSELVERVMSRDGDEQAEAELLRQGQSAMPAIMDRFPGPITADPTRLKALTSGPITREPPVKVGECGPLLRLIAGQRRVALPFVVKKLGEQDKEQRFWATFLLTELVYADAAERIVPRLFDEEEKIRRVARLAARALADLLPAAMVEQLGNFALASIQPAAKRILAIELLGELREPASVPALVSLLTDADQAVAQAGHDALVTVTRQDFGDDPRKWLAWWSSNGQRYRIEWLIDSLMHDETRLRHAAGEELKTITKEYFGYYDDLPKKERERAQQRYRDWWNTEGKIRFRKS